MQPFLPTGLLVVALSTVLSAGDWTVPAGFTSVPGEPVDQQSWFGAPNLQFGRRATDSGLPRYPIGAISCRHQFDADFDSLPGEVNATDLSLWAPVAPLNFGNLHVIALLSYRLTEFDTSDPNLLTTDTLHTIRMPILLLNDHSEEWIYGGMVMPAYAGDLTSSDNFSISAALGAGRALGPDLRIFGGVYYAHGFGEDSVIPGIAFTWRPRPRWEAYLLGPMGGVTYNLNDDWLVSLVGKYDSPTWHVEADSHGPDRDIEVTSLQLGLKLERRLGDHFWAHLTGGYSVARKVEIEDSSDSKLLDDDIDSGPFVQIGLNLRY